jgi:hypothetical protein
MKIRNGSSGDYESEHVSQTLGIEPSDQLQHTRNDEKQGYAVRSSVGGGFPGNFM